MARTRTIELRIAWYALTAGDGSGFVSRVRATAWSMSSCVMCSGAGVSARCAAKSPAASAAPAAKSSGFS